MIGPVTLLSVSIGLLLYSLRLLRASQNNLKRAQTLREQAGEIVAGRKPTGVN